MLFNCSQQLSNFYDSFQLALKRVQKHLDYKKKSVVNGKAFLKPSIITAEFKIALSNIHVNSSI